MAVFSVNGRTVTVEKNQKLIRYLRDELQLTSVKDGCSEGACGTCHVLIDGKLTKACIPVTDKLDGRSVLTVEGLSDFEKEAYTYAFGKAGAVQCGFCIPGMIMAAKSLIDVNSDPTREEAAHAIRNNICRCTGYVKIIDGILLAAKVIREGIIPSENNDYEVGSRVSRIDVAEKVQGYGKYPDDIYIDGMCYGSAVRSAYPRARVLSIDTSEAEKLPGVVCVLTAKDIPGKNYVGHIKKDQPTLIPVGEITHYLGDSVALVCARDKETLEQAKKLVKVEYEVLPAVHNPEEAAMDDAPLVFETDKDNVQAYKHVSRGDADGAIKASKYVLTHHFETPWTEHAFLEPECCVAVPLDNGGVKLLTTDQSAHTTLHECAQMLGVDYEHCPVENQLVGGGFGGKEDMSVQHHAALIAYVARVPVKVKLTRQESILRRKGERRIRHRRFCIPRRPRARTRLHPRGRPLCLREFRDRRPRLLYKQSPCRSVQRLRRYPDLLCHRDFAQRDGGARRHISVGDKIPQRDPPRRSPAQRSDRRRRDRLGRNSRGGQAVF